MTKDPVYFVHISDTHIGPSAAFSRHGHFPLPCVQKLVEVINAMPVQPDFIIHTGDVVAEPDPVSWRLAVEAFSSLKAPIYFVNGNHDTASDIRQFLAMGPHSDAGSDSSQMSYTFEVKEFEFLVLDARGPDEIDPHGLLPESQLDLAAETASADGLPLTIFIHYPVLPMNSPWMDENMLILNGDRLHEALRPAAGRIRGVFHGHIHQHMQNVRDGITYTSVASAFSQFGAWPNDVITHFDGNHDPGYSFVHLLEEQTIVHQHTFPRPS